MPVHVGQNDEIEGENRGSDGDNHSVRRGGVQQLINLLRCRVERRCHLGGSKGGERKGEKKRRGFNFCGFMPPGSGPIKREEKMKKMKEER